MLKKSAQSKSIVGLMAIAIYLCMTIGHSMPVQGDHDSNLIQDDPAARAMLRDSRETRYYMQNFEGFAADIVLNDSGKISQGVVNYELNKGANIQIPRNGDNSSGPWALEAVLNIMDHRKGRPFEQGDGRFPITFGAEDYSPNGRRVIVHDSMDTSYRIRDGHAIEVCRTVGGERFVISMMEEVPAEKGKYLPRHFTVTWFDAKSGVITRTEAFTDEYRLTNGIWFPVSRRILHSENGNVSTRIIEFRNPRIQFKTDAIR